MLKELCLENFVITKKLHVKFTSDFNVISGETGAGKTLLLQALSLLSGQRADYSLIREGSEKACLKAVFHLSKSSPVFQILKNLSFDISSEESLIIQRELSKDGKTKVLINHQISSLSVLKEISLYLFEIVSQNMQVELKTSTFHREFLDKVSKTSTLLANYQKLYEEEKTLTQTVQSLESKLLDKEFLTKLIQKEVDELSSIELTQENEDILYDSFKKLSHFQEIQDTLQALLELLQKSGLSSLNHHCKSLEAYSNYDRALEELQEKVQNLSKTSSDVCSHLETYLYETNFSDEKYKSIEKELSKLKSLKRSHGPTYDDAQKHLVSQKKELNLLNHLEEQLEDTKSLLDQCLEEKNSLANEISNLRHIQAEGLSEKVTTLLHELGMKTAEFRVSCQRCEFTKFGFDNIRFLIKNNHSQNFSPIESSASGGELARVLLALLLSTPSSSGKTSYIFDEIDANIGGETATKIGKKLKDLGRNSQVICITHFAQVATFADNHIKLTKATGSKDVTTNAKTLSKEEIQRELLRMVGGDLSLLAVDENHP